MDVQLLEDSRGVVLAETIYQCDCTFFGDCIEEGHPAIALMMREWDGEEEETVETVESVVPVALNRCVEAKETLEKFEFEAAAPTEEIAPTGFVVYRIVETERASCLVCEDNIPKGSEAVSFAENKINTWRNVVWCHKECISQLCQGFDNALDYVDRNPEEILSRTM